MTAPESYSGFQNPGDTASQWSQIRFMIQAMLRQVSTATVVKVMGVTNAGGVSPVGMVDVQPQVNLVDGNGVAVPHGTIYSCPYLRLQGGENAIILDPQVGDLGLVGFCDRDISSVVANKGQANPGSGRRFDWSDAVYIGGMLNGTPTQYVQFSADGITIKSPNLVKLQAPDVQISCATMEVVATTSVAITTPTANVNGNLQVNGDGGISGNLSVTGGVGIGGSSTVVGSLDVYGTTTFHGSVIQGGQDIGALHKHSGVQIGSGDTGTVV